MKKKKHTPQQIIQKLRKVETLMAQGTTVAQAAGAIEVTEQTFYRWRRKFASMGVAELRRFEELERENKRLKQLGARSR